MEDIFNKISKSQLIKLLVENTPVAYIILDKNYRIHYINDYFLKLRQLNKDDTLGEICYNLSNAGKKCANCAVERALATGQKCALTRKDFLPNGAVRFIDDYAIPLFSNNSTEPEYILEIMINRTEELLGLERKEADFKEMFRMMGALLETKDGYTATHSKNVADISVRIAQSMGLSEDDIFDISIAAALHDIGKVRIPDSIINKPDRLSNEEFEAIKKHPANAHYMISDLSGFDKVKHIVRHHHERFDGFGYPDRLAGEEISLGARIVAIADTYEAMTSTRSYRKALSHQTAIDEIKRCSGSQFDPKVVDVFLSMSWDEKIGLPVPNIAATGNAIIRELHEKEDKKAISMAGAPSYRENISQEQMLNEIFQQTPVGYIVMDRKFNCVFANDYFLQYMGMSMEEILDKKCYDLADLGAPCPNCAVSKSIASKVVETQQIEQLTRNGLKFFDMFAMPLPNQNGDAEYVVEIIIDRTAERTLAKEREKDFYAIGHMLSMLLEEEFQDDPVMSKQITDLQEQLDRLANK